MIVVVPDWIYTILALDGGGGSDARDSTKLLQILRLVRLLRLLRFIRPGKILAAINNLVDSEVPNIFWSIIKMWVLLLLMDQTACVWFLINDSQTATSARALRPPAVPPLRRVQRDDTMETTSSRLVSAGGTISPATNSQTEQVAPLRSRRFTLAS